jgi:hypothetical protein
MMHPLSINPGNIQQPTSNIQWHQLAHCLDVGCSMLVVGCWMFSFFGWRAQSTKESVRGILCLESSCVLIRAPQKERGCDDGAKEFLRHAPTPPKVWSSRGGKKARNYKKTTGRIQTLMRVARPALANLPPWPVCFLLKQPPTAVGAVCAAKGMRRLPSAATHCRRIVRGLQASHRAVSGPT